MLYRFYMKCYKEIYTYYIYDKYGCYIFPYLRASRVEGGGSVCRTVKGVTPASEMCSYLSFSISPVNKVSLHFK